MTRTIISVAALALVGCPVAVDDDDSATGPASGSFSVLTYNVHGLPSTVAGDDPEGRMPQIAPLLDDFAIVGLQESFVDEYYEALAAGASHGTKVRFAERLSEDRVYGPGLAVFAELPEVDHLHEHYTTCNGVLDGASDCLASKGFQAVRLELAAGVELDVYNTHFEAGGGPDDAASRENHVDQITAAMNLWSAGRPLLFIADTNLHPESDAEDVAPYEQLLGEPGLTEVCPAIDCEEPGHIDRIAWRDGAGLTLSPVAWANEAGFFDAQGESLSDHPAISAGFEWEFAP